MPGVGGAVKKSLRKVIKHEQQQKKTANEMLRKSNKTRDIRRRGKLNREKEKKLAKRSRTILGTLIAYE